MTALLGGQPGSGEPGLRIRPSVPHERSGSRRQPAWPGWDALTPRELDVVELVTLGATNQQTARRLGLSPHTVNAHLRHVFTKLGVCSRVELTRVAVARERDDAPHRRAGSPPDRSHVPGPRTPAGTGRLGWHART